MTLFAQVGVYALDRDLLASRRAHKASPVGFDSVAMGGAHLMSGLRHLAFNSSD